MSDSTKVSSIAKPIERKPVPQKQQLNKSTKAPKNEPSTTRLAVNRAGAVVMTPIAATAGVLTIFGGALYGTLNPNSTFDKGMTKGIQAAGQGADMLEKMWEGRYF